jgi:hypothetical protein
VGGGKPLKKNGAAGEGRNRRALLDIGNVVTLKGVEVKPNRPVTRFFPYLSHFLSDFVIPSLIPN